MLICPACESEYEEVVEICGDCGQTITQSKVPASRTLRILVVDDHTVVRAGLATLLEREAAFSVVAEAENGTEAIEKAREHRPDVIIMDVQLSGGVSGIDACKQILEHQSDTKIVMLSAFAEGNLIKAAARAGAVGYLLKRVDNRELLEALYTIARGDTADSPSITTLLDAVRETARIEAAHAFSGLTPQEIRILALILEGRTNREIARQLYLGEGTVRNYVGSILGKLGMSNRAEAAVFAVRHHIERYIPPEESD